MNGWQAVLSEFPYLRLFWDASCVVVPLGALFAFAGIFFISAIAKMLFIVRKRSAFDKCSRQLAFLGIILGWLLLIGGRVWLYLTQDGRQPGSLETFMLEISWMLLSLGVLLSSVYYTLWRILKNMPVLHVTIGMISAVQNCLGLLCILVSTRMCNAGDKVFADFFAGNGFSAQAALSPLWIAAAITLPLLFGMAGAFGSAWLPLRRKADDFGRDYYNAMLPWTVAWARNAWLILWLMLVGISAARIWQTYSMGAFNEENAIWESARLLLWLLPVILWTAAHRCKIALRGKWAIYLALLIALSFMLAYFLEITMLDPEVDRMISSMRQ